MVGVDTLRFALVSTSLGQALAACNARGLCLLTFGDDAEMLRADLARRFPRAERVEGDASALRDVVAFIDGDAPAPPLDLRGTPFQQRVWAELRRIPAGATASYAEIAAAIGQPKATRAVAAACAANPVALAVPCHRVLRSDGGLSGYRWGVALKRRLLARENVGVGGGR